MAENIRVLLVEPGEKPRLVTVEHTLEHLQALVGGFIQAVYPWEDPVALVCDDEGLFKGYPFNRMLVDKDGNPCDAVKGAFFICGLGEEDFCDIPADLAQKYAEMFWCPESFILIDGNLVVIREDDGSTAHV